ncbi:hypothetical protein MTR_8g447010 [Medicago truncatula]|uniref:Uncharacterized protein n=1 Tax=Medicago truncatula TaxID=3880 RepID=A0A072TQ53_MEDTR|nr:hypothetical protein MTR_8g447010 [Medicago truncatula]
MELSHFHHVVVMCFSSQEFLGWSEGQERVKTLYKHRYKVGTRTELNGAGFVNQYLGTSVIKFSDKFFVLDI